MKLQFILPRLTAAFLSLGAILAACSPQPTSTPLVETVVQTVEVTRLVQVTVPVEVTREVVVTQLIEVPVTVTPTAESLPGASATPTVAAYTPASMYTPAAQLTPSGKGEGFTPVFLHNQSNEQMDVYIFGPTNLSLRMWPGDNQKAWLAAGQYSYAVWINGVKAYEGTFKIVSIDKHDLFLKGNKAVLWTP